MKIWNILEKLALWTVYLLWVMLFVLTTLVLLKDISIGVEYKMIWVLLALLGLTISQNNLREYIGK